MKNLSMFGESVSMDSSWVKAGLVFVNFSITSVLSSFSWLQTE